MCLAFTQRNYQQEFISRVLTEYLADFDNLLDEAAAQLLQDFRFSLETSAQ